MANGSVLEPVVQTKPNSRRQWSSTFWLAAPPLLFAVASVLGLLVHNRHQTFLSSAAPALIGSLGFALAVLLLVAGIRRRFDACAAVIASIWVAGCLFHAGLFRFVRWFDDSYATVWSVPVAILLIGILTLAAARLPARHIRALHLALTAAAAVMVAAPAWDVAAFEWRNRAARTVYDPNKAVEEIAEFTKGTETPVVTARPPDIYYFVFDRFASAETLARYYDVDITETIDFLEQRGFHVVRAANSNYHRTGLSLASTFYMDYLDMLSERAPGNDWRPLQAMLRDHRVARFLKERGYRFIQFGSWWTGTFQNPLADENHPHGLGEFDYLYLRYTILHPLLQILPTTRLAQQLDWDLGQCQRVRPQIEKIKALGEQDQPLFVFAHILVPHGPYVFAPDGRCFTREEAEKRSEREGYVDQVAYATRLIQELVAALQSERNNLPIIIIQADEGPFPERNWSVPWNEASASEQRIKTSIISAYFFPNGDYSQLGENTTPVNSFRAVFNTYFGTSFPLLPNRIFVSPDEARLYDFYDVTENVLADYEDISALQRSAPAGSQSVPN
ncbi:MAG: hypothetical protein DIU63_12970 [Proteobacteria bacterium]|nr:MAG: hypothetical protein DIU63_12970 [Pseudomonadota bacterium]